MICTRGNHKADQTGSPDAAEPIALGTRGGHAAGHATCLQAPLTRASLTREFLRFFFDSKFISHEETLHLTTRPHVEERVVGHHQLVEVKFVSKPFPFCFMKDPLVVIVSVKTGTSVSSSPT